MNPSSALRLENLTKVYRRSHLGRVKLSRGVENISVDIRPEEVFGLLGLNGSGKTTTIKLILGLLFPTTGKVEVLGHPAGGMEAKRSIGYLPEVPYFYKYLSAREVLFFYGRLSGVDAASLPRRVEEVLSTVRMAAHADRPMREYSKGMLQRIGLAQAMLHDPRLLVFDEPVTGLDPLGLREMRELLLSLNKAGKTVFFSSHSISEVEKVCHRVGILVNGRLARVVEQGEWAGKEGHLEEIFVETVSSGGAAEVF
ncbi:MAG TPA: ABC transporter ATP-binding protein [Elusimicrobiota bacterium]|nr:ABC transporter ATP-binding protein [Elusimicrobiota bacterium]